MLKIALRVLRKTQKEVAEAINSNQPQLAYWMNSGKGPDDVLQRVETALGIRLQDVLESPALCPRCRENGRDPAYEVCGRCHMDDVFARKIAAKEENTRRAQKLYRSKDWRGRRLEILAANPTCRFCKRGGPEGVVLQVHHVKAGFERSDLEREQYASLRAEDVIVICKSCHYCVHAGMVPCPTCSGWKRPQSPTSCQRCRKSE
jgi:hypothetical protein